MNRTILLIDGDVLAYRASAVAESREVLVKHIKTGKQKVFKNKTAFKNLMKEEGKDFDPERWQFTDIQIPEDPKMCYGILKKQIEEMKSELFADEVEMFVSGDSNFRDALKLPKKYKGDRVDSMRPLNLKYAKKFLIENYNSFISDGFESDDYLIIRGYEHLAKGNIPIIVTVDKDANAYSGLNVYDFTQDKPQVIELPDLGSLWDTGKKITGNGFLFLCYQWILGDPVDFYKPYELSGENFGEKAAFEYLKNCTTKEEALQKVVDMYKKWYPEEFRYQSWDGDWVESSYKHMLDIYYKCCKMKMTLDDDLDSVEFLKKHNIEL